MTISKLITTPFGFMTTADEVLSGVDLTGKQVIVTGGASGIGLETVRALSSAGAHVTVASRHPERSEESLPNVDFTHLDLSDLNSINQFCKNWNGPLDILINNAGIMGLPIKETTADGIEMMFAVNHLGHFALSLGLHKALAKAKNARVVSVSSQAHSLSPVDFDDINFVTREYDPTLAYAQSKTANALFAVEAALRWSDDNVYVNAVTPGAIRTGLGGFTVPIPDEQIKTASQGAATTVLCAASPLLEGVTGKYFSNCNEGIPCDVRRDDMNGVLPFASDPKLANQLWNISLSAISE